MPDADEYAADTDPTDDTDFLQLLSLEWGDVDVVEWTSRPTRCYRIEATNIHETANGDWTDVGGGLIGPPESSPTVAEIEPDEAIRYYRVKAIVPLAP